MARPYFQRKYFFDKEFNIFDTEDNNKYPLSDIEEGSDEIYNFSEDNFYEEIENTDKNITIAEYNKVDTGTDAPPPPPSINGYEAMFDPLEEHYYYWNNETNTSTWYPPQNIKNDPEDDNTKESIEDYSTDEENSQEVQYTIKDITTEDNLKRELSMTQFEKNQINEEKDLLADKCQGLQTQVILLHKQLEEERNNKNKAFKLRDDILKDCDQLVLENSELKKNNAELIIKRDNIQEKYDIVSKINKKYSTYSSQILEDSQSLVEQRDMVTEERDNLSYEVKELHSENADLIEERNNLIKEKKEYQRKINKQKEELINSTNSNLSLERRLGKQFKEYQYIKTNSENQKNIDSSLIEKLEKDNKTITQTLHHVKTKLKCELQNSINQMNKINELENKIEEESKKKQSGWLW